MKKKLLSMTVFISLSGFLMPVNAQFNTVVDKRNTYYEVMLKVLVPTHNVETKSDTLTYHDSVIVNTKGLLPLSQMAKSPSKEPVRKKHLDLFRSYDGLPGLTISNLLYEIRKNGIQHEKVVLAQAILETGWFTSSVCRNKNNLFGLTNPRTGQYYEFDHWTESVKAYYTKVQHRYKGGNYLLWLDDIGYAEKKTYVMALIELLNQYFL